MNHQKVLWIALNYPSQRSYASLSYPFHIPVLYTWVMFMRPSCEQDGAPLEGGSSARQPVMSYSYVVMRTVSFAIVVLVH